MTDAVPEARLAKIVLYPVKALDGIEVETARLLESGALEHDREFVMLDPGGKPINGKRNAKVHLLRAAFDGAFSRVTLSAGGEGATTFALRGEEAPLEAWLTRFFGVSVRWVRAEGGSPDDTNAHGPTVVSRATLEAVASWFGSFGAAQALRRFRPNLVLDGCPSFWEDRLVGPEGTAVRFAVGEAELLGVNPCRRCVVPARDPRSGEAVAAFQQTFAERRRATLPPWAEASRFDTAYRLAVNTTVERTQAGRLLRVGDPVRILGLQPAAPPG